MLILDKHKAVERMLALAWASAPEAAPASPRPRSYRRIAVYERRPGRARVEASAGQPRATRQPVPQTEKGTPPRRAPGVPLSPIVF